MRGVVRTGFAALLALVAGVAAGACGEDSPAGPGEARTFVVQVGEETFRIRLRDPERIARARRIVAGQEPQRIVIGPVRRGDGGFNAPWRWHLDPDSTEFAEVTIELCDGTPSYLEAHLDEWLATVRTYCPWGSRLVREEGS